MNNFDPQKFQKDLQDYISKKYGENVSVSDPEIFGTKEGEKTEEKDTTINFDMKPKELEEYLNQYVVDQEEAVEVLATKVCTHFNRMRYENENPDEGRVTGNIKSNILMLGPTGVGKTYMIKLIANKLGVPFVKGDATKFSETGYVGGDVEDLVRELVHQADGDIKTAEYGIIYLDEIDKIAASVKSSTGPDVSRTGVQRNLLKIMEESEVDLKTPHDIASQMEAMMQAQQTGKIERKKINTRNILFVVSGAFNELVDIIRKRLNKQPLGFLSDIEKYHDKTYDYLSKVETEDFLEYGFESEFIGRLPVVVNLRKLNMESLYRILKNENCSVIAGKKRDFISYGLKLEFEDEAFRKIAEIAYKENTGARGLIKICERTLIKYEKELPSSNIKNLRVTESIVENPGLQLQKLLLEEKIMLFKREFYDRSNIELDFTDDSKYALLKVSENDSMNNIKKIIEETFHDYEYGLKLIGKSSLTVTSEIILNHRDYLDQLIKNSYGENGN